MAGLNAEKLPTKDESSPREGAATVRGGAGLGAGESQDRTRGGSWRSGSDARRSTMGMNRGHGQPWEIKLGAPHVMVWVGLAVGSIVGAYFIGFFSGRSVGYETARAASAVEVAKLAVSERFTDTSHDDVSDVYDKLNKPAMLDENVIADAPKKAIAASDGQKGAGQKGQQPQKSPAAQVAEEIRSGVIPAGAPQTDSGPKAADVDSLFDDSTAPIESSDTLMAAVNDADLSAKQVRVLGGGSVQADVPDKAVGHLLEERLALARANQAKELSPSASAGTDSKPEPRLVEEPVSKAADKPAKTEKVAELAPPLPPSAQGSNLMRQVLPQGYFAQVAAPTKLTEAEDIAKRLKKSGFPVVIETANVRGENYYRVLVGPETDKVTAERLVGQLQRERAISGIPFVRRVK